MFEFFKGTQGLHQHLMDDHSRTSISPHGNLRSTRECRAGPSGRVPDFTKFSPIAAKLSYKTRWEIRSGVYTALKLKLKRPLPWNPPRRTRPVEVPQLAQTAASGSNPATGVVDQRTSDFRFLMGHFAGDVTGARSMARDNSNATASSSTTMVWDMTLDGDIVMGCDITAQNAARFKSIPTDSSSMTMFWDMTMDSDTVTGSDMMVQSTMPHADSLQMIVT